MFNSLYNLLAVVQYWKGFKLKKYKKSSKDEKFFYMRDMDYAGWMSIESSAILAIVLPPSKLLGPVLLFYSNYKRKSNQK